MNYWDMHHAIKHLRAVLEKTDTLVLYAKSPEIGFIVLREMLMHIDNILMQDIKNENIINRNERI